MFSQNQLLQMENAEEFKMLSPKYCYQNYERI